MTRLRIALLPHVFVAGHRSPPPHPPLITARDLRTAIAANAALMTFAGDDDATRAPAQATSFSAPAAGAASERAIVGAVSASERATAGAPPVSASDRAAAAAPPVSAPGHPGRDRAA
jgi:hypothetical protein